MTGNDREVITVTSGATLEIKDSNNPSKEHKFTVNDDGLYVLNEDATSNYKIIKGGVVTGGKASGIVAADKSKVIFSGGNIVGCKGNIGGIDFCGSELHMTGGNIIGCTGTYGGGIYAQGGFTIEVSSGTIDCTADNYSAIGYYGNANSKLTISGGTFYGDIVDRDEAVNTIAITGGTFYGNVIANSEVVTVAAPGTTELIKYADTSSVTKGEAKQLTFSSYADFGNFNRVEVDDATLTKDTDYTVSKGSTVVKLAPLYVASLSAGTHTIEIVSSYSGVESAATATFTISEPVVTPVVTPSESSSEESTPAIVSEPAAEPTLDTVPKTGGEDYGNAIVFFILSAAFAACALGIRKIRRQ